MARNFGVYASTGERVYLGDFSEVPEPYRRELIEAIDQWGDVMVGWGVNELIYSLMHWHDETAFRCAPCDFSSASSNRCTECGQILEGKSAYKKNEKIARLLMCVGSLNRIRCEENG
ncbi:hypothetical protein [Candidatus Mycalebacterium sp.]